MKIGSILALISLTACSYLTPKQLFFENSPLVVNCPSQWNYQFMGDTLIIDYDSLIIRINYESDSVQEIDFRVLLYYFNKSRNFLSSMIDNLEIRWGPSLIEMGNISGVKAVVNYFQSKDILVYNLHHSHEHLFTVVAFCSDHLTEDETVTEEIISEISFRGNVNTAETNRYYNNFGKYSINVPPDWEITENQSILRCRSPLVSKFNNAHCNLIITSNPVDSSFDLQYLFRENVNQLISSSGLIQAEVIEQGYDTIDGSESMWLHYRYGVADYTMLATSYILIMDGISYTLSYHSPADIFPKAKTDCEQIIASLKLGQNTTDLLPDSLTLEEKNRFINYPGNYSVIFPVDWELIYLNPDQSSICFISPPENVTDSIQENFLFNYSNQCSSYQSASDFFEDYVDSLGLNYPGFTVLEQDSVLIDSTNFIWFISTIDQPAFSEKFLSYVTIKDTFCYLVTFTASKKTFDDYVNLARKIMETWNFQDFSANTSISDLDEDFRYVNYQGNYSIIFPPNWIITNLGKIVVAKGVLESLDDDFQENITILTRDSLGIFSNLTDYFENNLNQLSEQTDNFTLYQQGDYEVDNYPAKFAVYSYDLFQKEIKFCSISIYRSPRIYTITFQDYPRDFQRHLPVFYEIMKTFKMI
ncbi:MAG: hypothetical protein ACP5FK_06540 [bacterium]